MQSFEIRCPTMSRGVPMDVRHVHQKAGGLNLSPPLHIGALPAEARSVAFILADRDADDFVHWAVVDLPAGDIVLPEGASGKEMPEPARELRHSHQSLGYYGPNPPPRDGDHKYELVGYALDVEKLEIDEHVDAEAFDAAAREHAVGIASTYWLFENR